MLKRISVLLLAAVLVFSLSACKKEEPSPEPPSTPTQQDSSAGHSCILASDPDKLCESTGISDENPNAVDVKLYNIFNNVMTQMFTKEKGTMERSTVETTYCKHGTSQAQSLWTLVYDAKGASSSNYAAPVTATYTTYKNKDISNVVHYKVWCDQSLSYGTPTIVSPAKYSDLEVAIFEVQTEIFRKGFLPHYLSAVTSKKTDKGNFILTATFTPEAKENITQIVPKPNAERPTGTEVLQAVMEVTADGKFVSLALNNFIQDANGQEFWMSRSEYTFSDALTVLTPQAPPVQPPPTTPPPAPAAPAKPQVEMITEDPAPVPPATTETPETPDAPAEEPAPAPTPPPEDNVDRTFDKPDAE